MGGSIHSLEERDQRMIGQVHQIVGFNSDVHPDGGDSFEVPITERMTELQERQISALAAEYSTTYNVVLNGHEVVTIRP
jgi:hypothetical protein